jgi:hypothetical protein
MTIRKSSASKFLQTLALVAVGAFGLACNDTTDTTPGGMATTPSPMMSPAMTPTATPVVMAGPITDLGMIHRETDQTMLADRTVQLTNVPVLRVINDQFFWVGSDMNQRVLVMSSTPMTGANRPKQGQNVNLSGMLQRLPAGDEMRNNWKLPASAMSDVNQARVYLMAQQVTMAPR